MPRKLTQEEYCNKFYKKNPKDFEVIGEYVNTDTEIMIRHTVCGNEYLRKPEKLLSRGASCPKCNPYAKIRRTQDEFCRDNKMNLYRIAYTELEFIDEIVLDIIEKERSTTIPKGSTLQAYGSGNGESVEYTMI